jgi:hypothetical protein
MGLEFTTLGCRVLLQRKAEKGVKSTPAYKVKNWALAKVCRCNVAAPTTP